HSRRASGAPHPAELVERRPGRRAEETDHDLAIRERGVVVGDFAQAGAHDLTGGSRPFDRERREGILPFSVIRFFAVPPSQARMGAIPPRIRIATRESQLAMRQTSMV